MASKIQLRRDTAANWTSVNPILASGEIGFITDTNKFKIGNGSTAFNSLSFFNGNLTGSVLDDLSDVTITSAANGDFLRWNGSAWINDAVNLSTDTVGDYVASLVAGTGISLSNNSGEASTPTVALTNSSLTINGTSISLGGTGTITAAAGTLTGSTLASGVTSSSLTSFGSTPTITAPVLTLSTSASTTDARISWDSTNKKIIVGNGSISLDFAPANVITNAQTASYTLALADKDKLVEIDNASANNLTVPLESSVAFPIGTQISVLQTGAGTTTLVAAGGVTLNATPGLILRARWSSVTLIKRAANTWVAIGDLRA
jgi:hypothetical protein